MRRILIIDNYDSFVYNVYQYLSELDMNAVVEVYRNDKISIPEIEEFKPTHIVISPGPGRPENAGICLEVIRYFHDKVPILGICLGNQAIGMAFGGRVVHAGRLMHGKVSQVRHDDAEIFSGVSNPLTANRYHSLVVEKDSLPVDLVVTALSVGDGEIMALQHSQYHVYGLQFHPESILTPDGKTILNNFLNIAETDFSVKNARGKKDVINTAIADLVEKRDLDFEVSVEVMDEIMSGKCSDALISAFLVALRMKGETGDELAGMAKVMQDKALHVKHADGKTCDTCGTGGDGAGTFNISTCSAFVVCAGGIPVAKHGNRSVSSRVGSADVLEAGGYRLQKTVQEMEKELSVTGFTFMFAPFMHPAMKNVMPVRKELKTRTAFNMLGPVTNPSRVRHQVIGIFDFAYAPRLARALQVAGTEKSAIVNGGFTDELTTCDVNNALLVAQNEIMPFEINLKNLGLSRGKRSDIQGESEPSKAFALIRNLLAGKANKTMTETVALNAGVVFWLTGSVSDLREGVYKALNIISSGAAYKKLLRIMEKQNA